MRARESDVSNVPDVSGIKFSYMRTHTYERVPVRWGFFRILKIIFFLLEYQCVTTKIADFDFSLSYLCTVIQKTGRYQARIRVHAEIPDRSQKSVRKISYRWLKADVWNENQNQNKQLVHLSTNNLSTLKKKRSLTYCNKTTCSPRHSRQSGHAYCVPSKTILRQLKMKKRGKGWWFREKFLYL